MLPRCGNCDNWRPATGDAPRGYCHARPPRIVAAYVGDDNDVEQLSLWPSTKADDGCRSDFVVRDMPDSGARSAPDLVQFGARVKRNGRHDTRRP
jgi:hypothetical protein